MFDRILHWHVESDAPVLFVSFDAQRTNGVHGAGNVAESEIAITEMSDAASFYLSSRPAIVARSSAFVKSLALTGGEMYPDIFRRYNEATVVIAVKVLRFGIFSMLQSLQMTRQ